MRALAIQPPRRPFPSGRLLALLAFGCAFSGCTKTETHPAAAPSSNNEDVATQLEDATNMAAAVQELENRLLGPPSVADPPACNAACGISRNMRRFTERICDLPATRSADVRFTRLCADATVRRDRATANVAPRCPCAEK